MALTDDQKAMLRLLAQREEGYEDMAALMGISVDEVRARVKEALAEVDEPEAAPEKPAEPPPAPAPPPPPAPEPPSPAEQEPPAPSTPEPQADTAKALKPQPKPTAAAAPASGARRGKRQAQIPSLSMPKDRGALIGLVAGALVVVIFVIVLIVGSGGSDSSSTTTSAEGSQGSTTTTAAEKENLTEALLAPVSGGDTSGRALFGRYKKNVLLQVEADGLDPSPQGQSYTVWLYRSPKLALQIGAVPVDDSGKIAAQFQIPPQLLAYVASGAFNQVDVSLTTTADYKAALAKAKGERKLPPHIGDSVLRGEITGPAIKQQ